MSKTFLFTSSAGIDHYMVEDENGTAFASVAHTDPVIEHNKAAQNHNDGYTQDRSMRRVASIPHIIGLKWLNEEGWWWQHYTFDPDVAKKLAQKLNSNEYLWLRTASGELAVVNGELH